MGIGARDIGLLLLGMGIFFFSLVILHFYVTHVLPEESERVSLAHFCNHMDDKYVIKIGNYTRTTFNIAEVLVGGKTVCSFAELTPGSERVCLVESNEEVLTYDVRGYYDNGKKITISDICMDGKVKSLRVID